MKNKNCLIIAEAGVNHNGSLEVAKQLIDAALEARVDYIKFQTFITELIISKNTKESAYQGKSFNNPTDNYFDMLKRLELSFADFRKLNYYCLSKGIGFLSTAFDLPSLDFLDKLGQTFFKIPSGEITNKPYLQHIAKIRKPVIMSTGMATMEEISAAINVLTTSGLIKDLITVLHCNTEYPTPMKDVNLNAMLSIRDELGIKVGYSDHTLGIEIPIAAVALGAEVIEKHFTLDRNMPGPDHKASLEPDELKSMVNAIRNVELAIAGNGIKVPSESEKPNMAVARKSIHLKHRVTSGTMLTSDRLIMKRPGNGISPMDIDKVIGETLKVTLEADTMLSWYHLRKSK